MSFCLGLPLPLSPSILPSITSLCRELPLRMCPIQFVYLVLITSITPKDLFSSTIFNTSSFVLCSVQLILSILLHIHILYYNFIITALTARAELFLPGHLSWNALVWRRH